MKKILSIIATAGLVIPTVATVVSCGPKIETDVLLLLPGLTMNSSTTTIARAYTQIAKEFNQSEEMNDSSVHVKVQWEKDDAISTRYASGQQLPDLYVAYPDLVSSYVHGYDTQSEVRNMEEAYFAEKTVDDSLKKQFWTDTFYQEGVINKNNQNNLYVMPLNKSFDVNIVNLKVFLELVSFVNPDLVQPIKAGLKDLNPDLTQTEMFETNYKIADETNEAWTKELSTLNTALSAITTADSVKDGIRTFFQKSGNVLGLAKVYEKLFNNAKNVDKIHEKYTDDERKMYSVGLDSVANRIFTEYADLIDTNETHAIDPATSDEFFYKITDINPAGESFKLTLDNNQSTAAKSLTKYFDTFRDLGQKNPNKNDADVYLKWAGSLFLGNATASKTYSSNLFADGTMLVDGASTAGIANFKPGKKEQFDHDKDLLVVSGSTESGNKRNVVQQGPGIAGFKSTGKNAGQKEKVVTKFLQYLLKPKNLNRLALMAGYVPSTTDSLKLFEQYKNGNFNNVTNEWKEGTEPENAADFEQIIDVRDTTKKAVLDDSLIMQFLNDFANINGTDKKMNMNVVTTKGNPAGGNVRSAIDGSYKSQVYQKPSERSFADILNGSRSNDWTMINRLTNANAFPETWRNATIDIRIINKNE